jgi:hypothetical protein
MSFPQRNDHSNSDFRRTTATSVECSQHLTNGSAEETLRLIAQLPAPEGLVHRVQTSLKSAPREERLLHWPYVLRPAAGWMHGNLVRGAAAAAIVCIVAGGGWGIYSRVQPPAAPAAKVIVTPTRIGSSGGFSSAGAMRTPDTLNGPILKHPIKPVPHPAEVVVPAKPASHARAGKVTRPTPPNAGVSQK